VARLRAAEDLVPVSLPFLSTGLVGLADRRSCSSVASMWTISSVTLPFLTTR
jgi:hypothetical protein